MLTLTNPTRRQWRQVYRGRERGGIALTVSSTQYQTRIVDAFWTNPIPLYLYSSVCVHLEEWRRESLYRIHLVAATTSACLRLLLLQGKKIHLVWALLKYYIAGISAILIATTLITIIAAFWRTYKHRIRCLIAQLWLQANITVYFAFQHLFNFEVAAKRSKCKTEKKNTIRNAWGKSTINF